MDFYEIEFESLKNIDLFFVVTNRLKKSLAALGISNEKMHVIYNGIEYDKEKAEGYNKKKCSILMKMYLRQSK